VISVEDISRRSLSPSALGSQPPISAQVVTAKK
jgi:hypothetical protein